MPFVNPPGNEADRSAPNIVHGPMHTEIQRGHQGQAVPRRATLLYTCKHGAQNTAVRTSNLAKQEFLEFIQFSPW
jgi:hypothetical protein